MLIGRHGSPSVSVAMCTYNGSAYLPQQLESIAGQSLRPRELVICDDGSADNTLDIATRFANDAPFPVRIVRNPSTLGSTANFAQAMRLCIGDFIALSDQDDIWYPHKLDSLLTTLCRDESLGGTFSDGDLIDEMGSPTGLTLWGSFSFTSRDLKRHRSGLHPRILLKGNVVTGMTMMIRRRILRHLLPIPPSWVHDAWLAWMLCLNSRVAPCPMRLVAYRLHATQQIGAPSTWPAKVKEIRRQGLRHYLSAAKARRLADCDTSRRQLIELAQYLTATGDKEALLPKVEALANSRFIVGSAMRRGRTERLLKLLSQFGTYYPISARGARGLIRDTFA